MIILDQYVGEMDDETAFVRASWLNVLGNLLKLVVEGSIGLTFGSLALIAEAANSLGDLLASLAILTWGRLTYVGPDENHPHGHERLEPLTAFLVGIVLIIVALRLLYGVVVTLLHGAEGAFALALIGGLGIAIVIKVVVYWYTTRINRRLDSTGLRALRADALTDIYATTAAVIGVVGVAVGLPMLDPPCWRLCQSAHLARGHRNRSRERRLSDWYGPSEGDL